jgi:hypothetical protein
VSRYNNHMNTGWQSCVLLTKAFDPHRGREVELRAIPGEFALVGVWDGVDAWVAPVVNDPFSVNISRLLDDFARTGIPPKTSSGSNTPRARRALTVAAPIVPPEPDQPRIRKPLVVAAPSAPTVILRRR